MTTRSGFLTSAVALGAAMTAPDFPATLIKPPVLRRGDRVGLIAPASPLDPSEIDDGVAHLASFGLVPVLGAHARAQNGYLAGTDAQRAEDFNKMARDASIRAIVALRGGYGTMRILDALDYDAIRRDPKIVMGYSDITAIVNAVATRSGVIAFHGPVASHGSSYSGAARAFFQRTLMSSEPIGTLHVAHPHVIAPGRASGRLAGGNLTLASSLAGTPYAIPSRDTMLFLEETHEMPYRIDRMLTQLQLAGNLHGVRGVLWGQCTYCTGDAPTPTADEVIDERLRSLGCPALAGAPIGHIATQWVVPVGAHAELDASEGTLTIPEAVTTR
ncbi:MAG TPA: LD-carboxypeptidase [Candidatus Acidoferrales bacterium]|jgi:muramoyltetrapeptide carboxypeptidase|nr:LD-carboxypeptidase [Candidatus Acidoferrales bacterium]